MALKSVGKVYKNKLKIIGKAVGYNLNGKNKETLWTRTQKADHETGAADNK